MTAILIFIDSEDDILRGVGRGDGGGEEVSMVRVSSRRVAAVLVDGKAEDKQGKEEEERERRRE